MQFERFVLTAVLMASACGRHADPPARAAAVVCRAMPRPAAYDVSSAVVADAVTGLEWQRGQVPGRPTQEQAAAACDALELGGHGDWRLPARLELVSLVDYGRNQPSIDAAAFPGTESDFYWTSTPVADLPERAWYVGFAYGFVFTKERNAPALARCVRDARRPPCPSPRFSPDPAADVVHDTATGLTWQRRPSGERLAFKAAIEGCAARGGGWRLPSIGELQTLIDESRTEGARIDPTAFPDAPADFYWSSSSIGSVPEHAWYVNFLFGNPDYDGMPEPHLALCVK